VKISTLNKTFLVTISILQLSCSGNIFSELGSKSSDDALFFDAKAAVDSQQYQSAIDIITLKMSVGAQAQTNVKEVLASGYAGKCGLNFINFVNSLATTVSGSAMILVSKPFVGVVVDPASCLKALQTLDTIGTTAQRTATDNAFASIIGMSMMGSAIRAYTDLVPTNGDGIQDAVNISCGLTNTQIDYVVLGFGYMSQNFSYLTAAQLGSTSQTTLNTVIATCTGLAGAACTILDPALITNPVRDTLKDLMNTSDFGIGTVASGGNPITIQGACP
jgi:hypothetical protein